MVQLCTALGVTLLLCRPTSGILIIYTVRSGSFTDITDSVRVLVQHLSYSLPPPDCSHTTSRLPSVWGRRPVCLRLLMWVISFSKDPEDTAVFVNKLWLIREPAGRTGKLLLFYILQKNASPRRSDALEVLLLAVVHLIINSIKKQE